MKYRKQQVSAMKKLLKHYQKQLNGEKSNLKDCPLCDTCRDSGVANCSACVWELETGRCCGVTPNGNCSVESLRNGVPKNHEHIPKQTLTKWRKRRIKELTAWIKKYE